MNTLFQIAVYDDNAMAKEIMRYSSFVLPQVGDIYASTELPDGYNQGYIIKSRVLFTGEGMEDRIIVNIVPRFKN